MADPPRAPEDQRIVDLTIRHLDGQLTEQQARAFTQWMREDPAVARRFVEVCFHDQIVSNISAVLSAGTESTRPGEVSASVMARIIDRQREAWIVEAADNWSAPPSHAAWADPLGDAGQGTPPPRVIVIPRPAFYGGIAALIVLAISLIVALLPEPSKPPADPALIQAPAERPVVAELARLHNAAWATPGGADVLTPGALVREGDWWRLTSGLAEVEMSNGARVVLEAPVSVRFTSGKALFLERGRLAAFVVERARGFEVQTASTRLVDLGTEFGVEVDAAGVDAHVFRGRVQAELIDEQGTLRDAATLLAGHRVSARDVEDGFEYAVSDRGRFGAYALHVEPVAVGNPSFELDGVIAQRTPTYWQSNSKRVDVRDAVSLTGEAGGDEAGHAAVVYSDTDIDRGRPNMLYQDLGAALRAEATYVLRVRVGRTAEADEADAMPTAWKIALFDADSGAEFASASGTLVSAGLIDQELTFTADAWLEGRRLRVGLINTNDYRRGDPVRMQLVFDDVRLEKQTWRRRAF